MPHSIGYVDDTTQLAHYELLAAIKTFCEANSWTTQRYVGTGTDHEFITAAPGYTGPDGAVPAYVGLKTYHSVPSDYYNVKVATFTGYVAENTFEAQPGAAISGVPTHNQRIDYWMTINARRLAVAMKVGTPVYESFYLGYMLPYATPRQFPYPIVVGGMLSGAATTRFSDTSHSMPYKGSRANFLMRSVAGSQVQVSAWPWSDTTLMAGGVSNYSIRPTGTYYPLLTTVLYDSSNVYGELDGIYAITGFDNVVENTLTIGGIDYVVIQDVGRNGFVDYYAMRLDT